MLFTFAFQPILITMPRRKKWLSDLNIPVPRSTKFYRKKRLQEMQMNNVDEDVSNEVCTKLIFVCILTSYRQALSNFIFHFTE